MTDTPTPEATPAPHESWLHKLHELLGDHGTDARPVVAELATRLHELEQRLAALEAVAVKDAPAAKHAIEEAATVAAEVEKAAGAP